MNNETATLMENNAPLSDLDELDEARKERYAANAFTDANKAQNW